MTFDSVVMAALVYELNSKLINGRTDKIHQPSPLDVVLTIRNNSANYSLLLSAEARSPRAHLTATRPQNPKTPPNFCMLMRKYMSGARFMGAEQVDFDRILHLKFAAFDGERITIVVEIMGKHSNIVLINDAGRILGAAKPVGRSKNRYREILPGRQYIPPPSQNKVNPLDITRDEFDAMFSDTFSPTQNVDAAAISSWLTKTFTGISPFLGRELAARGDSDPVRLGNEFIEFFASVRSGEFMPVLITNDLGQTIGFYVFPTLQQPESNQHERPSVSIAADVYFNSALPRKSFDEAKQTFIHRVEKEIEAREKTLATIQEGVAECEGAERFKQIGELILSQMATISEKSDSAELVDYFDPNGASVNVELDSQLSVSENAEAYFRKYRKALSGAEALRDRLNEASAEIKLLRVTLESEESIDAIEQVQQLEQMLASKGIRMQKQEHVEAEKRKAEFDGHRISKVVAGGWEILVGQNSDANDFLLTRVAKPNDMWVHVKASPSAHVIIRTNGKPDALPRAVLHTAAELAAQHSDSKHSSLVPVDYTLRKHVRKPKGAPAGKAIYQNEKTIYVTPNT